MKKITIITFITIISLTAFLTPVLAVDTSSELIKFNEKAQLGGNAETDPIQIIVNIINIILGLLGIIFTIIIMYNGFKYMTAGGKADQAKLALHGIRDSVIGVAIIFASYIIVNYVIIKIIDALSDTVV